MSIGQRRWKSSCELGQSRAGKPPRRKKWICHALDSSARRPAETGRLGKSAILEGGEGGRGGEGRAAGPRAEAQAEARKHSPNCSCGEFPREIYVGRDVAGHGMCWEELKGEAEEIGRRGRGKVRG